MIKLFRFPGTYSSHYIFTSHVRCCSYKSTILLPKTKFTHKVNATTRRKTDRIIENDANFANLYEWQRSQDKRNEYILHDGPPYANGDVHIGHAVNKLLKDITVRYKLLKGYKVHFVPGWDCHGLPIELKVLKDFKAGCDMSDLTVRKKAYEFSQKTKGKQMMSFKEWGILAAWNQSYFTCHTGYVIQQLKIFQDLYDQGVIYQDHKPVYWSPCNKTSLAEAELEYNHSHVSPSVYVKFNINKYPDFIQSKLEGCSNLSALIWTTTPWTLPSNQAVCYSADKMYSIVLCKNKKEYYLIAEDMISSLSNTLKTDFKLIHSFKGDVLKDFKYLHPMFTKKECSFFPASHVTMTKGTGLVHTAPNHGLDDYLVAKQENLPLDTCLVDDNGCFTSDAGAELEGKYVLSDGSKQVISMISENVISIEDYVHSYPYDWRSKTPVIIKSSHQWFIDVQRFKAQAVECLENVKVFPDYLKKVFLNQVISAPQWCISRQRCWGVPIPAFYTDKGTPVVHRDFTDHLCHLIKERGIHCWWEMNIKDLLPMRLIEKAGLKNDAYTKGSDIMDIWLDSGISWNNVLPEPHVSDVCIEGIDQIRGWFNSSLMTSVALRGKAPYKSLVFHGFTTDAEGCKMSKSEGNVINPDDIIYGSKKDMIPPYGIDVMRWWVASHACQHENIAVKTQILEECSQNINKLRNVFKFLLGNLHEFSPQEDIISPLKMRPLDLYMLHCLQNFSQKIQEEYDIFQYKSVAKNIMNFTTNEVSSFYCQLVKDRLYCDSKDSIERLACQTVLYFTLNTLVQSIGSICPHLAEEVVMHHPNEEYAKEGLFRTSWPCLKDYLDNTSFPSSVLLANQIRQAIIKSDIKTLHLHSLIVGSSKVIEALKSLNTNVADDSGWTEFFQMSSVVFYDDLPKILPQKAEFLRGHIECTDEGKLEPFSVVLYETKLEKCLRCRRFFPSMASSLCRRCLAIINNIKVEAKI